MNKIITTGAAALLIAASSSFAMAQGAGGGGGGAGAGTVAQPGGPGSADQMKDKSTGMTHETPSTTGSTGMTTDTPSTTTESSDIKGQRPSPVEGGGAGGGGGR